MNFSPGHYEENRDTKTSLQGVSEKDNLQSATQLSK